MNHREFSNPNAISGVIGLPTDIFDHITAIVVIIVYRLCLVLKIKSQTVRLTPLA